MRDVFLTFLRLGMTSFGGPIAHLGYFRREFVERRAWLDEELFTHVVAFCSVLPGPTSSQVGLIVGLLRAGAGGALAAWLGFTLPSAALLTVFALLLVHLEATGGADSRILAGGLAGLAAAATAIVAQAVLGMAKSQCPDRPTQTIAAGAAALSLALHARAAWQWVPIAFGALAGLAFCAAGPAARRGSSAVTIALPRVVAPAAGIAFVGIALGAAAIERFSPSGFLLATVVRAGSLVFGGGHVVLPLLQALVPAGLIDQRDFYAGYGATQAMPGPLFTFAAFLGAANSSELNGVAGATVATLLIFLPSFLLVFALLPVLDGLRSNPAAAGALRGANASVVGLLGALLFSPLILALEASIGRSVIALGAFTLVAIWKSAPWIAVLLAALAGAAAAALGAPT
jgi:chromate transporter